MRYVVVDNVDYYQGAGIVEADSPEEARAKYEEKWQIGPKFRVIWVGALLIDDNPHPDYSEYGDYIDCGPKA